MYSHVMGVNLTPPLPAPLGPSSIVRLENAKRLTAHARCPSATSVLHNGHGLRIGIVQRGTSRAIARRSVMAGRVPEYVFRDKINRKRNVKRCFRLTRSGERAGHAHECIRIEQVLTCH